MEEMTRFHEALWFGVKYFRSEERRVGKEFISQFLTFFLHSYKVGTGCAQLTQSVQRSFLDDVVFVCNFTISRQSFTGMMLCCLNSFAEEQTDSVIYEKDRSCTRI